MCFWVLGGLFLSLGWGNFRLFRSLGLNVASVLPLCMLGWLACFVLLFEGFVVGCGLSCFGVVLWGFYSCDLLWSYAFCVCLLRI